MSNMPPTLDELERQERGEAIADFLAKYTLSRRSHTRDLRDPALLLSFYIDKPNVRRYNAPVLLGGILQLADIVQSDFRLPANEPHPRDTLYADRAEQIFDRLEPYREGPEKVVAVTAYKEVEARYGELQVQDRRVEIGRLAVVGLRIHYPQAVHSAREATLALQLDALQLAAVQANQSSLHIAETSQDDGGQRHAS